MMFSCSMCIIRVYNRLFFRHGPVAPVRQAWQPLSSMLGSPLSGHARTTLSSDLVRTLAVAPTAFSYDKDDGEGVGAGALLRYGLPLYCVVRLTVYCPSASVGICTITCEGELGDHHGCLHRRGPFGGGG